MRLIVGVVVGMWMFGCLDGQKTVIDVPKGHSNADMGYMPFVPKESGNKNLDSAPQKSNPENVMPPAAEGEGECSGLPNKHLKSIPKVFYGTSQPKYLPMTLSQVWAVGTFGWCSGLLITPKWVLSASHCNLSAGHSFCMGKNASDPNVCIKVVKVHDNPYGDMALAQLKYDATQVFDGVEPVPLFTGEFDDSWIGKTAEAAGYGRQETGYSGEREFTAQPIAYFSGNTVTINGEGKQGVCFGDSGGPLMVIAEDGSVRVAGALSGGDSSCVGYDHYTRVDLYRDWIEKRTGPTPLPGPQPCGEVSTTGKCAHQNTRATWCGEDGILQHKTCGSGESCSWSQSEQAWRCVAPEDDACDGLTDWGACNGNVLTWCGEGGILKRDCGACGETCVPNDQSGFYCVPSSCGELLFEGECNGSVVTWCNRSGEPESLDCAQHNKTCGWKSDELGHYCVYANEENSASTSDDPLVEAPAAGEACGELTYYGECQGNTVRYCKAGVVKVHDCGVDGMTCGWTTNKKGYWCVQSTSTSDEEMPTECGDVSYAGTCVGDVVHFCLDGALETYDCGPFGKTCGWKGKGEGNWCVH